MSLRSTVFTSLAFCVFPVLFVGCAASTEAPPSDDAAAEEAAASEDDLTAAGGQLVGSYFTHSLSNSGFARLQLEANGTYSAEVDQGGATVCVAPQCLVQENGRWNASKKKSGGFRLRVTPSGQRGRWYDVTQTATTLALSRSGVTETIIKLDAGHCFSNDDCTATEACVPRFCQSVCMADDPFCCGPAACQPKPKPELCGNTTCGTGLVCCNPIAGICTKPGGFCIQ